MLIGRGLFDVDKFGGIVYFDVFLMFHVKHLLQVGNIFEKRNESDRI